MQVHIDELNSFNQYYIEITRRLDRISDIIDDMTRRITERINFYCNIHNHYYSCNKCEFQKNYSSKKIQRVWRKYIYNKRDNAARVIQNGLHNWLAKPVCNDGTIGIIPRLAMRENDEELTKLNYYK